MGARKREMRERRVMADRRSVQVMDMAAREVERRKTWLGLWRVVRRVCLLGGLTVVWYQMRMFTRYFEGRAEGQGKRNLLLILSSRILNNLRINLLMGDNLVTMGYIFERVPP